MSEPLILDNDTQKKVDKSFDKKSSFVDFLIRESKPSQLKSSHHQKEQKLTRHLSEILKILKNNQIHQFSYDWSLLGLLLSDLNHLVQNETQNDSLEHKIKKSETLARVITENRALKKQAVQFFRSFYGKKLDKKEFTTSQPNLESKKEKSLFQFASLLRQINELEKKNLELINDNKEINQMVQMLWQDQGNEKKEY